MRLRQRFLSLPLGMDVVTFLQFDGKPPHDEAPDNGKTVTLGGLRDHYLRVHEGSLEDTTIDGMRLHFRHLVATLGERFPIHQLSLASLQEHAQRRETMKGIGGKLSPATIRKELITLRTAGIGRSVSVFLRESFLPSRGSAYKNPKRSRRSRRGQKSSKGSRQAVSATRSNGNCGRALPHATGD